MVAPRLQCTNHHRRAPQGPLTRAVFLLDAAPGNGIRSRPGANVRVVGRGDGAGPGHVAPAPNRRLCALLPVG